MIKSRIFRMHTYINLLLRNALHIECGKVCRGDFHIADHLHTKCGFYMHHGIYVGDNKVIHYDINDFLEFSVYCSTLEEFSLGNDIYRLSEKQSPLCFSPQEAARRAYSRLNEKKYNLFFNNCETFVRWCRCGKY